MIPEVSAFPIRPASQSVPSQTDQLRAKAAELETAFLAEMLGHTGIGQTSESFGGGIGEEQFASFLRQEQAAAMVRSGGIGLTEALFRALSQSSDNAG